MSETEFARAERYWHETCKLTRECDALKAENAALRAALEPFAEVARRGDLKSDDHTIWDFGFSGAQFAAAYIALNKKD